VIDHLVSLTMQARPHAELCLAGGVALNSQANGRIALRDDVEDIFIQPQAGDSGTALGAAYWVHFARTGSRPASLPHAYWGPSYTDRAVERELLATKLAFEQPRSLADSVARILADGGVVGWFQGRSECGPRALGNRSILADCSREGMDDLVNDCVKRRERWRPFAAAVLAERRRKYVQYDREAPYMLLALPLTELGGRVMRAASHVDQTTRLQTVTAQSNKRFYELLTRYEELTGHGALMNTSFNVKGEPIVERPREAIADFWTTGLDALAIGPFLLRKSQD
jgi:carbamoyltransferase